VCDASGGRLDPWARGSFAVLATLPLAPSGWRSMVACSDMSMIFMARVSEKKGLFVKKVKEKLAVILVNYNVALLAAEALVRSVNVVPVASHRALLCSVPFAVMIAVNNQQALAVWSKLMTEIKSVCARARVGRC
jgi:hypothetical protein